MAACGQIPYRWMGSPVSGWGHSGGFDKVLCPYIWAINIDTQFYQIPSMPEGGKVGLDIDKYITHEPFMNCFMNLVHKVTHEAAHDTHENMIYICLYLHIT